MQVIDLIENPNPELWSDAVKEIEKGNEYLRENYLNIDFSQFLSFPCVVADGKIVCFSGLQYDEKKWGQKLARCSSRMWVHPDYRVQSLTKFSGGSKFLNSTYCLPVQFQKANELGLDALFISREKNLSGFKKYLNLITINCQVGFELKPQRYWVCGSSTDIRCCQHVAVTNLTNRGKEVWLSNMTKYIHIE